MNPLRKYWGPFCPLTQDHSAYTYVIYPVNMGFIREHDTMRELTPQELDVETERLLPAYPSR